MSQQNQFLRIAHITDVHISEDEASVIGFKSCLTSVYQQQPRPDLIINGGDSVRDALKDTKEIVDKNWADFHSVLQEYQEVPVKHILGNHDVCAYEIHEKAKERAIQELGLHSPFYSFEQGGWKFIMLDSTRLTSEGKWYEAGLEEEQFNWLKRELKTTSNDIPVCVVSHIPTLSAAAFLDGDNIKHSSWVVPGGWMHLDSKVLVELFSQHSNVKLCISGHLHLSEEVKYNGVTYICNGAVSGNWWKGNYQQTAPGYGLLDLFADGTFRSQYIKY